MVYYGLERVRSFDTEYKGLDKLSFQYVIFGMRDLYRHISKFEGRNKDSVGIFVTSERAFLKVRNRGFRRVFVVRTLLDITPRDVIDADGLDMAIVDTSAAMIRLSVEAASTPSYVDSLKALGDLAVCIRRRDVKGCAELFAKHSKAIATVAGDMVDLLQDAHKFVDVQKINTELLDTKRDMADLKEKYEEACKALASKQEEVPQTAEPIPVRLDSTKKDEEITMLRSMLAKEQDANEEKYAKMSEEIQAALDKSSAMETQLSEAVAERDIAKASSEDLESKLVEQVDAYNALVMKHNSILEELHNRETELAGAYAKISEYKRSEEDLNANKVIAALKAEIDELSRASLSTDKISRQMPIIGPTFAISATKVVVLKEIKPAIYMNTLISQMNFILRSVVHGEQKRSYCIVVLDTLTDQFREFKYKKHGFAINKAPVVTDKNDMQVVVTNKFDVSFLKNTLKLNTFDYLIVLDRLRLTVSAVKHSAATVFYLIDSYHDIEDFKLRNSNLVIFGDSLKCTPSVSIMPDSRLFDKEHDERKFSLYRAQSAEKILQAAGVI